MGGCGHEDGLLFSEKPGMEPLYSLRSAADHPAIWADRSLSHRIVLICSTGESWPSGSHSPGVVGVATRGQEGVPPRPELPEPRWAGSEWEQLKGAREGGWPYHLSSKTEHF